jgi:hypothetical protein
MVDPEQKALVDIAAEVMGDEEGRIGITYTGFCLTALPHKRLPDDQPWEKRGHRVTLTVQPGLSDNRRSGGQLRMIGVPYGARARMILLYLQTQAIRTVSREVELGRSMRDWLGRMGLSWGGETGKALREQAARIAACTLRFRVCTQINPLSHQSFSDGPPQDRSGMKCARRSSSAQDVSAGHRPDMGRLI